MAKRLWRNTTWARWRRVRQLVQILLFVFFVYLLFAALQRRVAFPLADLFFRLDPLGALGAMLASREWIPKLGLALLTVGLTLLLGRVLSLAADRWARRPPAGAGSSISS